jgi:hypothetical protein
MPTDLPSRVNAPRWRRRSDRPAIAWLQKALAAALAAGLIAMALLGVIYGPVIRQNVERATAEEIAQENRVFCEKFGMGPATSAFASCVGALTEIRRRHEERLMPDSIL